MKNLIFTLLSLTILLSDSFTIAPIIYVNHESAGSTWSPEDESIALGGWGFKVLGDFGNINLELDAYNNRFFGIRNKPNYFSSEQGLGWEGHDPDGDQFDFDVSNMKVSYNYNSLVIEFGKFTRHWGPGNSSLIISNKAPSFMQFGFNWTLNDNIHFEYFHGSLRSLIPDNSNAEYYNQVGAKIPELNRYIAAHRLNWKLTDKLTIGASEAVIYGVRSIDLMYLLPFAPFLSLQQYLGDLDNIQWELDLEWKLNPKINLYGAFIMDEWRPGLTFDKPNRNWFAYQFGINGNNFFIDNDGFRFEFNWTDHRVYRHRFSINDYYSHGYPIGFWGGPHAQELFLNYTFNKYDYDFSITYSNAKRGELTEQMLQDQYATIEYDRFANISESISEFKILVSKNIRKGFNVHFGIALIDWENGNFDPFYVLDEDEGQTIQDYSATLVDVSKTSISIGFSQNFDIFKQIARISNGSIRKSYSF